MTDSIGLFGRVLSALVVGHENKGVNACTYPLPHAHARARTHASIRSSYSCEAAQIAPLGKARPAFDVARWQGTRAGRRRNPGALDTRHKATI
jgi:hypothetical protein